jgi:hypothetical protein
MHMPAYRIYSIDKVTRAISEPASIVKLPTDDQAIAHAEQLLDGKILEVWDGARRVIRLERSKG